MHMPMLIMQRTSAQIDHWVYSAHVWLMWCFCLQRTISESTAEAELKALCEAAHDIRFLLYLTEELLYPPSTDNPV